MNIWNHKFWRILQHQISDLTAFQQQFNTVNKLQKPQVYPVDEHPTVIHFVLELYLSDLQGVQLGLCT